MRLIALAASVLASAFLFAAHARADVVDTVIEIVKPELKPARPIIDCAIAGGNIATCALGQGKAELQSDPYVQDIIEVVGYAKAKDWPNLIAKVGVTAACTAFGIPMKSVVCDSFAGEVVQVGAFIIAAQIDVTKAAGEAVAKIVSEGAQLITCAFGYNCPTTQQDPNSFTVVIPGQGAQSMRKYDLNKFWSECYAARNQEGIMARISDAAKFKRMVAVPVTRDPGNSYWAHPDALGKACISAAILAEGLNYFEQQKTFHTYGWDPYAKEMNPRWRDMVFKATADLLEDQAFKFNQSSQNWINIRATVTAQNTWDHAPKLKIPGQPMPPDPELVECVRAVELPAAAVVNWSRNANAVGDSTILEGAAASDWAGKVQGFCEGDYKTALQSKIKARRDARDKALAQGCVQETGGMSCPAPPINSVSLSALGQCQIAYSGRANACKVASTRQATPAPAPAQGGSVLERLSRVPVIINRAPTPAPTPQEEEEKPPASRRGEEQPAPLPPVRRPQ